MRKIIIAGNWKMNKTVSEAIELANGLKRNLYETTNIEIVICPTFIALNEISEMISQSNIDLGAQNVYWEENGAFTGEISLPMLKDIGCKYVILGHSERRKYFNETNVNINKKIKATLEIDLIPIVCVGETLKEREDNKTFDIVKTQVQECLKDISLEDYSRLIIAYEPVWAIGTGKNATPQQAQEVHKFIRDLLVKIFNKDGAEAIRIQYGGSVKPGNIQELINQPDIDGALIGGASLDVNSFTEIVKTSSEVKKGN
ncbi:MAG: triose-phosphate isomerase [Candidatus Omnitrophota bacterium]